MFKEVLRDAGESRSARPAVGSDGVASSRNLEFRSKLIYYPRVAELAHYAVCKLNAKGRSEVGTI